ncbi:hypothetical protein DPMN_174060 [Dreissena polymorpha]|uniref:Uncharacterized protein n=1 Tax=Dreissena polymorpha TaxID=45954 RepID=A0A9D4IET6_DREPO|nr:hypothetical protein DPMN_174060 [Dreissena polymorpha]
MHDRNLLATNKCLARTRRYGTVLHFYDRKRPFKSVAVFIYADSIGPRGSEGKLAVVIGDSMSVYVRVSHYRAGLDILSLDSVRPLAGGSRG